MGRVRQFLLFVIRSIVLSVAILMLIFGFVSFYPDPPLILDAVAELRLLHLFIVVPLLLITLLLRWKPAIVVAGIALFINLVILLVPFYIPDFGHGPVDGAPRLKIVAANIDGAHNKNFDGFSAFVRDEDPDILVISEYSGDWHDALIKRLPKLTYDYAGNRPGPTAILSKIPISFAPWGSDGQQYGVRGTLNLGGRQILLIADHPQSIRNRERYHNRNVEMAHVALMARAAQLPVLLAGDLNTAPWTYHFGRLLRESTLIDSENGHGLQLTWSDRLPFLMVPIDHCLHSPDFDVLDRHVGPRFGSDHLPIAVTLQLRPERQK